MPVRLGNDGHMTGVARDFTLVDAPRAERDGSLILPVVGGDVVVEASGWMPSLADARPGDRVTARVIDSGPGWWLAGAARTG